MSFGAKKFDDSEKQKKKKIDNNGTKNLKQKMSVINLSGLR